ncbi:hypothetical protein AB6A40_008198 [Gnathostoma spinigerum]|uniref:Uncharacterized protein n=1 Tax=Gnathostoma spinigerum TaxID=75299 RepID=A0ABD6ETI7_9BILA
MEQKQAKSAVHSANRRISKGIVISQEHKPTKAASGQQGRRQSKTISPISTDNSSQSFSQQRSPSRENISLSTAEESDVNENEFDAKSNEERRALEKNNSYEVILPEKGRYENCSWRQSNPNLSDIGRAF